MPVQHRPAPLRLAPEPRVGASSAVAERIALENRSAAGIGPDDPRWVLAVRAAQLIEGGRAAILTAQKRRELTRLAIRMGLREFDAALVIAIVQDAARSGRGGGVIVPVAQDTMARLRLVSPAEPCAKPAEVVWFVASFALACALFAVAARWLGS